MKTRSAMNIRSATNSRRDTPEAATAWQLLREQQSAILRWLLAGVLAITLFTLTVSDVFLDSDSLNVARNAPLFAVLLALVAALALLARGRFILAVALASGAMLVRLGYVVLSTGLSGQEGVLMALFIPVALVGLTLGRKALLGMTGLTLAFVVFVAHFESREVPWIGWSPREPLEPSGMALLFGFILLLLAFFFDRFAISLRQAFVAVAAREQALAGLNRSLRAEVREREAAQREQALSEERLRLALDATQVGLWHQDLRSGSIEWSPTTRRLFGLPEDTSLSQEAVFAHIHPDDRQLVAAGVRRMHETGEGFEVEYRLARDEERWLVGRGSLIRDAAGVAVQVMGVAYDVTAAKRAEVERQRLLESERAANERLGVLVDVSGILGRTLEHEEALREVARAIVPRLADWCAVDLLGPEGLRRVAAHHRDPARLRLAEELAARFPADPAAEAGVHAVIRSGRPEHYPDIPPDIPDALLARAARDPEHLRLLRDIGLRSAVVVPIRSRREILGTLTLVHAESGRRYGEADVRLAEELAQRMGAAVHTARLLEETQRLNESLETRIQERVADLQTLNRELESFSYSVSHDLRTPLRGIDGFSRTVLEEYGDRLDDVGRGYLARVIRAAERMGELIDDLLDFSRLARLPVRPQPVDLSALASLLLERFAEAEPEREVDTEVAPGLLAEADPKLLEIALQNLIANAWKFTQKTAGAVIAVGRREDGVYFVRDNGAGFDMAYASKLFTPFQRLHDPAEFKGTGIGLATAARIIERHGGRLWAEAEPGAGATFFFTLGPVESAPSER
jgi:PAS domain S-box-containing protein